ncbi:hypothetical protein ACFL29_00030 [Patescibacteria group bacterium]
MSDKQSKAVYNLAYNRAVKLATAKPSQISVIKSTVEEVEGRLDTIEFQASAELYGLLNKAKSPHEQREILNAYFDGLLKVDEQNKITLIRVWNITCPDAGQFSRVMIDADKNLVIAPSNRNENSRQKNSVYAFNLKTGKNQWAYELKRKNNEIWQIQIHNTMLFCLPGYSGESDDYTDPPPFALLLETGELVWTYQPDKETLEEIKHVCGVFDNCFILNGDGPVAVDTTTGEARWRTKGYVRIHVHVYIPLANKLIIQTGDRKISWISPKGKISIERNLRFPKKNQGFIDAFYNNENEEEFYVSVWGFDSDYDDEGNELGNWEYSVIYAINKNNGKVRKLAKLENMRCQKLVPINGLLYICGKDESWTVDRKVKKPAPPQKIERVLYKSNNGLLFCPSTLERSPDELTFSVRDAKTNEVKWQRKDFQLLARSSKLLFGREEKRGNDRYRTTYHNFVILDQETGKEMAIQRIDSVRGVVGNLQDVIILDETHFVLVQAKEITLYEIQ